MFRVGTAALRFGHGSREGARAGAHFDGSVTRGPHVSVHTNPAVHIDGQTGRTLAAERALGVNAAAVHADAGSLAFIDVCAVASIRSQGKTRFANALKAAIFINAHSIEAHVGGGTFIVINAVLPVRRQLKAGIADALKTPLGVNAATIAAHHSVHYAFINVDTGLFGGSSLVTLVALAVIRSRSVGTVSIDTGITHTFIHIDALSAYVLLVSHVTFTSIAVQGWDAASIQTQICEMLAHIHSVIHRYSANMLVVESSSVASVSTKSTSVAAEASSSAVAISITVGQTGELVAVVKAVAIGVREVSVGVDVRGAVALGDPNNAQAPELIRAADGTHLRDRAQSPAAAGVTAALHFVVLPRQLGGTTPICQSRETGAHTLVDASGAVRAGDVAPWTGAHVAPSRVGALASVTHSGDAAALVNIFTLVVCLTLSVACWTFALIRAHSVDAVPSSAQSWHGLALVHILTCSSANVGDEASPAGVRLSGTLLAGVAPGSTDGGAAERLGAHDATELPLAHLVIDLSEARSCPVVSLALRASETIDTGTSVGPDAAPTVLAAILTHGLSTMAPCVALLT